MSESKKRTFGQTRSVSVPIPSGVRTLLQELGRLADAQGVAAYAVGGCVRDWVLGIGRITDLDVAVVGDGIAFAKVAAQALEATLTTHEQFGTATLERSSNRSPRTPEEAPPVPSAAASGSLAEESRATAREKAERKGVGIPKGGSRSHGCPRPAPACRGGQPVVRGSQPTHRQRRGALEPVRIDVASCRKEVYAEPAAYPNVTAGGIEDDLFRRDFTINAMAVAINPKAFGTLMDPFGGFQDLKRRQLRVLHPKSFFDDPSRILRAVRFVQRYRLAVESKTAQYVKQAVASGVLARLNRGRLRKELEQMVKEPDPLACLARLGRWLNEGPKGQDPISP